MDWIYDLKRKDFDNVKSYRLTSKEELEDIGGFVIIPNELQHFLKDRYGDYKSSARPSNIVFINKWYECICKIEYVECVCYGNEFCVNLNVFLVGLVLYCLIWMTTKK